VNIKKLAGAVAATAVVFGAGAVPQASAVSNIQLFGVQETLKDLNGPLIGYTVTGLMPSADPVPYPVAGRLYEATVTANALVGTVIPVVPFFNARAESGANYRVLANVSTLSGAPIGQGGSTTGKIYFDVVGDAPNSVVFNNGAEDILGWVQPPAISPAEVAPSGGAGGGGPQGATGSTGPNQAGPNTSGGGQGAGGGIEGSDAGGGDLGGAPGASGGGAGGGAGAGAGG
jgi:Domain of unknown function (DUF1942)